MVKLYPGLSLTIFSHYLVNWNKEELFLLSGPPRLAQKHLYVDSQESIYTE